MSETTSEIIDQTLHNITSTSSLIMTNTKTMKTIENISSKTNFDTTQRTITSLFTMMTKAISTTISNSTTVPVKSANMSLSSSTSTKPSEKSDTNLLHIIFSLLYVTICVTLTILIVCFVYWRGRRQQLAAEDSSIIPNTNDTERYTNMTNDTNRFTNSSLSSTIQYNETELSNTLAMNYERIYEDDSL